MRGFGLSGRRFPHKNTHNKKRHGEGTINERSEVTQRKGKVITRSLKMEVRQEADIESAQTRKYLKERRGKDNEKEGIAEKPEPVVSSPKGIWEKGRR